jgi:[acyl-carrier-protein] S-malonyltransferase
MLPWLESQAAARPLLDALAARLGDWRQLAGDPTWLHSNGVAQVLLTGVGIAAWQVLAGRLPVPAVVAGYSVGELAAFAAAGVLAPAAAVDLAAFRAQAMNDSVAGRDTGLLAVQGARALHCAEVAEAAGALSIAILINEERVIVGGDVAALDSHAADWAAAGLRCTRLPIGIASHTPAMAPAAAAFAARLAQVDLRPARASVVCNLTGAAHRRPQELVRALAGQLASTVRWDDCMDCIAERNVRCVLEVGPGSALAAMWRERHPGIPARSIDEFNGLAGVEAWVRANAA